MEQQLKEQRRLLESLAENEEEDDERRGELDEEMTGGGRYGHDPSDGSNATARGSEPSFSFDDREPLIT